ncbi:MAG: hypothetical protein J6U16_05960 [Ruminococcus sp.]|nr:hypothetical protein [Ruminococcus sp.]
MKKYIALILTGALLAGLCSCEDKPDNSEPVGDVTAPAVTTDSAEPQFLELTEADFTPVDIQSDIIEGMPSEEISCTDLSGLSFGERMSPCKAEAVIDEHMWWEELVDNDEMLKKYEEASAKILSEPCRGFVDKGIFIDDKLYIAVNYDDWCGEHDSALYCYDTETDECRELVTHTGLDYDQSFKGLIAVHGKPMYRIEVPDEENGGIKTSVRSIDPESGEEETVCEISGLIQYFYESEKGFGFYVDNGVDAMEIKEFDLSTKEIGEPLTAEQAESLDTSVTYYGAVYCDGVPAEVTGGFDGEKYTSITVKTQYYTVQTDLNFYSKILLWKDKFCIASFEDISGKWLYTYDIKSRERLKMKFDGFKNAEFLQTDKAFVTIVNSNDFSGSGEMQHKVYYIIPELGAEYRIGEGYQYICGMSGGTASLLMLSRRDAVSDATPVGYSDYQYAPDKLFTFETPQVSLPNTRWWW